MSAQKNEKAPKAVEPKAEVTLPDNAEVMASGIIRINS